MGEEEEGEERVREGGRGAYFHHHEFLETHAKRLHGRLELPACVHDW